MYIYTYIYTYIHIQRERERYNHMMLILDWKRTSRRGASAPAARPGRVRPLHRTEDLDLGGFDNISYIYMHRERDIHIYHHIYIYIYIHIIMCTCIHIYIYIYIYTYIHIYILTCATSFYPNASSIQHGPNSSYKVSTQATPHNSH